MPGPFARVERPPGAAPRIVDGRGPLRFALGNAYYLTEEAARGRLDVVDETLSKLRRLGVRVVRAWAFHDDPRKPEAIRRGLARLEDDGLRGLDRVLARARAHELYLILPLVNYWDAYGGTRQWCAWAGLPDPVEGDPRFFTDARLRARFCEHVAALLDRRNPETGLRYGEDETVLCWELMNEPRDEGLPPGALLDWARVVGGAVRAGARQLISLGEEGQGPGFAARCALPELDLMSLHIYPEKYGVAPGDERDAGVRWIEERAAIAHAAGKPLYVGELGLGNEQAAFARFSLAERRAIYRAWFDAAVRAGVAGIGPWLFCYDARPDEWDDFTWYARDGLRVEAPQNRYADLVAELAAQLSGAPPPSR